MHATSTVFSILFAVVAALTLVLSLVSFWKGFLDISDEPAHKRLAYVSLSVLAASMALMASVYASSGWLTNLDF